MNTASILWTQPLYRSTSVE